MSNYSNSEIPNGIYYVDVAVLAKIFAKRCGTSVNAAYEWLTKDVEVPSVDVQPVVHGEWIKTMEGNAFRDKCSECESLHPNAFGYNWCPNCGAKMDKRKGADDVSDE